MNSLQKIREFALPELLRCALDEQPEILQVVLLRLGDAEDFFRSNVNSPEPDAVRNSLVCVCARTLASLL